MLLLLSLACTAAADADTADTTSDTCWTDLAAGDAAPLATGFADGTEGAAFSDGRLLVTAVGTGLMEVGADGTVTTVATLDHALGLAPAAGSVLVADPGDFSFDGSGDDGRLLLFDLQGNGHPIGMGMANPNFVAAMPWGDVLVSDDTNPLISAVSEGAARPWLTTIDSPNGMGLSPDGRTLYVVSTFLPEPPLWSVPLDADGTPGTPVVITTFETGAAPDGLAVSADGTVWVALNLANKVVKVDPRTGATETVTTDVATPASLAFGTGDAFDPCSLYVTELYGDSVWRVATGTPGLALETPTFAP